jgi:hypothetical protein
MRLPDLVAYQAAVQHPATAFADSQLRAATVAAGRLGLPRAVAGNFAVTYQLRSGSQQWAVRCFHREAADRASRYAAISTTLARSGPGPLVPIEYLSDGVRVGSSWYPITKMVWIEGRPLNRAVEACLGKPAALRDLERRFVALVADLRKRGIAHGDLQHGNILVDPSGALHLVDYDGMFVPALRGRAASESGDPNFQHPRRGAQFDTELDRFAALVIVTALRALAAAPHLWDTYNTDDNLLFRRVDFVDPSHSALFHELRAIPEVRGLSERLARACQGDYAQVPLLEDEPAPRKLHPVSAQTPAGVLPRNHVAVLNHLYGSKPRRPRADRSWKLRRTAIQHALALSPEADSVATADTEGRIILRHAAGGTTERTLRLPRAAGHLQALAYASTGQLLAVTSDGPNLVVWDASQQTRLYELLCSGRSVRAVALSDSGGWLVAATEDGMLRCWELGTPGGLATWLGRRTTPHLVAAFAQPAPVNAIAVASDGRTLAVASARGGIVLYALPGGHPNGRLAARGVCALSFVRGASDQQIAVGTSAGCVDVWDLSMQQMVAELPRLEAPIQALSVTPVVLATSGRDGSIGLRRLAPLGRTPAPRQPTSVVATSTRLFDWLRRVALL